MTRHVEKGMALVLVVLLASGGVYPRHPLTAGINPAAQTPEEQREEQIIKRFLTVLEKNPRRGTALDRIYGYHVERGSLDQLIRTYRERANKNQTDGVALMIVALLESQRGKDADAVTAFRQAEKRLPE